MKNVQTNEELDVDENELEDLVCSPFFGEFLFPSKYFLFLPSW